MRKLLHLLSCFILFFGVTNVLEGQNNLEANYLNSSSVPDHLNICGESDFVTVRVKLAGLQSATRENITAELNLFKGVRFEDFDATNSSSGVNLIDDSNINKPIFELPDMSPEGILTVDIVFSIKADCNYIDTIEVNNDARVFDVWNFSYNMNNIDMQESDQTADYKDAFLVPIISSLNNTPSSVYRINDCFDREILISNSGLVGRVDTIRYTNTQGAGGSISEILINGESIPFDKEVNAEGDTMISLIITDEEFIRNTIGSNPGNGDNYFDPDERVTIVEKVCVISCDLDRASNHFITWGCYGQTCNSTEINDFITLGTGSPNPVVTNTGSIPNVDAGYCQQGTEVITYSNQGNEIDEGFGAMIDVEVGVGLGKFFVLKENGFEIVSISVAGIDIPNFDSLIMLDNHPVFINDPDGPGGLEDIDGDGFYDDLGIGESVELIAMYNFTCVGEDVVGDEDYCANNIDIDISASTNYTNSCNERLFKTLKNFQHPNNKRPNFENYTDPDADITDGVFIISHSQQRSVSNFDRNCSSGEQLIVTVELPDGVTPIPGQTVLYRNELPGMPRISSNIDGNVWTMVYDVSEEVFLNGIYFIEMAFRTNCEAEAGDTKFYTTFDHYCVDCDCRHSWFCGEITGPRFHPSIPPCEEITDIDCTESMRTTGFDVERTTFGYTDETYTTKVNPNNVNTDIAISCDSVKMTIRSIVGDDPITDSIGFTIMYDNVLGQTSDEEIFFFGEGEVTIISGGNTFKCDVNSSNLDIQIGDNSKLLTFDMHECLADLDITLSPGDVVDFEGHFSVNPDGPYTNNFELIPNFRAAAYSIVDGRQNACDNYGVNYRVAKTNSRFLHPSQDNFPKGCQEANLDYYITTDIRKFDTFFENEYRKSSFVDSISFDFDLAIVDAFSKFEVSVSIPGHPVHGNDFFPLPGFDAFPDGHYTATFDTLSHVPSLNSGINPFTFRIKALANCGSESASSDGDNVFNLDPTIYFRDKLYSEEIGDGSCSNVNVETRNNDINYTLPPTFSLMPLSNPNVLISVDTGIYIIRHCNTSVDSDAGLNWIAFEDEDTSIQVVVIEDISDPTNPINLDVINYEDGQGYFAYASGLKRAITSNSTAEICNTFRIKVIFKKCGLSEFIARAGWNCTDYDEPDWTPELYDPCDDVTIPLSLTALLVSLDADVALQPDDKISLCEPIDFEILVRNTEQGNAFDIRTEFFLPLLGTQIVPNSLEIAFPPTAAYVPITTDPVLTGASPRGEVYELTNIDSYHPYLDQFGLPGFDAVNPNDSNEFKLKFQFIPSCGFVDAGFVSYNYQGVAGCGQESNIEFGETLPLFIDGIEEDLTKLFFIELGPSSFVADDGTGILEVDVTNLTSTPTSPNDFVQVKLPIGTTYTNGTVAVLEPISWAIGEPDIDIDNGVHVLTWNLPEGMARNERARFTIDIVAPSDLDCTSENIEVGLLTFDRQFVGCALIDADCNIEIAHTEGGEQFRPLPIANLLRVDITTNKAQICDAGEQVQLIGTATGGTGDLTYIWNPDTGLNDPNIPNPVATITETINYTLTVIDEEGCIGAKNIRIVLDVEECACEVTPEVSSVVVSEANCGENNGQATVNMVGSAADYNYTWSTNLGMSNMAGNQRIELPFGGYRVTITEKGDDECQTIEEFIIRNTDGPIITNAQTTPATCQSTDGSATLSPDNFNYVWEDGTTGASRSDLSIGVHFVTLTDPTQPDCPNVDLVVIGEYNPLNVDVTVTQEPTCGNADGAVTLTTTGGSGNYTYQWLDGAVGDTRTNLVSGVYVVNVEDNGGDGCQVSKTFALIDSDVASANVTITDTSHVSCYGLLDGGIEFEVDYAANFVAPADTILTNGFFEQINGQLGVGEYCILIRDADGCTAGAACFEIEEPEELDAFFSTTPACGNGGTIETIVTGGTGDYTFNWGDGNSNQNRTDVASGFYSLTITDENNCPLVNNNNIEVLECPCTIPVITSTVVTETTCDSSNGQATINVEGDPASYNYIWIPDTGVSNPAGNKRNELPFGGYRVTISDGDNLSCQATEEFIIRNTDGPQLTNKITTPATCQSADGTATLTPSNFNYTWEDGTTGASRTDLAIGVYFVTFTDPAREDCPNVDIIVIGEYNPLNVEAVIDQTATCGNADGAATITVTGGSGDYNYQWNDGGTGATRTDLRSGAYVVNIEDNGGDGCQTSKTFAIVDGDVPSATVAITDTMHISCTGLMDGGASFTVNYSNDFVAPADTILTNGFFEMTNGILGEGEYCVLIIDANGCTAGAACFEIRSPDPLDAFFSTTPDCENGGSIETIVTGGTGEYTYNWGDGATEQNRVGLENGFYSLTITDENNCTLINDSNIEVSECPCTTPEVASVVVLESTCGNTDGAATINIIGDAGLFTYTWSPDIGIPNSTGNVRTELPFGAYRVTVSDSGDNSCSVVEEFIIRNMNGPELISKATTPATCQSNDGTATLLPDNYTYEWEDGSTSSTRTDLGIGIYFVTFSDPTNAACPNVDIITIGEYNPLNVEVVIDQTATCGNADGAATLTTTGGSGDYDYQWSDGGSGASRTDLRSGAYVVNVKDNAGDGCQLSKTFAIVDGDVPSATVTITDTMHISCYGLLDGGVNFTVDYSASFVAPADTILTNGFFEQTNGTLGAGEYCVLILDANGCTAGAACFEIEEPEELDIFFSTTPGCNNDGTIETIVTGGTGDYNFDWEDITGNNDPQDRAGLAVGDYFVTITDENGCRWEDSQNPISIICNGCTNPTLLYTLIVEAECGVDNGIALIDLAEDEANYNYTWTPELGTPNDEGNKRSFIPAGAYIVEVNDINDSSCGLIVPVVVTNKNGPISSIESTTDATCGVNDGIAILSPDTLNYTWSDGLTGAARDDLGVGLYFVTFTAPTDTLCINVLEVEIGQSVDFTINANIDTEPDCGASNGAVTITIDGGSGNFTYLWSDGNANASRTDLEAGIYEVVVTDVERGCSDEFVFTLNNNVPAAIIDISTINNTTCNGDTNGSIDFTVDYTNGFVAPADTIIYNGDNRVLANGALPKGDYCIVIKDANDCIAGSSCFTIEEPEELELDVVLTQNVCDSGEDAAELDLTTTGGTGAYHYDWEDIPGEENEEDRTGLASGAYAVTVSDDNNCMIIVPEIIVDCRESCEYFRGRDTIYMTNLLCEDFIDYCVDIPLDERPDYEIFLDGEPYMNGFGGCDFDSLFTYAYFALPDVGNGGPYMLNSWIVNGQSFSGEFQDIDALVAAMNNWDPDGDWENDTEGLSIVGGEPLSVYSNMSVTQLSTNMTVPLGLNSKLLARGFTVLLENGEHELIIRNIDNQCADTIYTVITCSDESDITITDEIYIYADTITYCIEKDSFNFETEIETIENICPINSGEYVIFTIDSTNFCITYTGIELGGPDRACIVVTDSLGNIGTIEFNVNVIPPETDYINDTIFINQTVVHCLDTTQLGGTIVSVENICPEKSDGMILFTLDTLDGAYCVTYEGIEFGTDTACYVICDSYGICDTTIFEVTVNEFLELPTAVVDYDTTTVLIPLVIDILQNDTVFGGVIDFGIVEQPRDGQVTLNMDGTVTYVQEDRNICEREDMFSYYVCNPNGCDTAQVFIWIECDDLVIFNAVSPNNDGVNDVFYISGIEAYPNNRLCIYNRWGNKVYDRVGYQNEWNGVWDADKDLPDGTYFYILDLNDEDKRRYQGYLELLR